MLKLPQRDWSAGMGLFFTQLPQVYWKKSVHGSADGSIELLSKLCGAFGSAGALLEGVSAKASSSGRKFGERALWAQAIPVPMRTMAAKRNGCMALLEGKGKGGQAATCGR